jgi:hypothetical protein
MILEEPELAGRAVCRIDNTAGTANGSTATSRTFQERTLPARTRKRPSWRPRRARNEIRPSMDRRDWKVDRLVRRGASCLLCGRWPAPFDRLIDGKLVLVCALCERRANTGTRLDEVVREDWRQTVEN